MHKIKLTISVCIFSILLSFTSIIKTQTRIVEKKISKIERKISVVKNDLHETQLDFSYLSSPNYLSKKIVELFMIEYLPIDFSRIYLSYLDFNNDSKKIYTIKKNVKKKTQKN
jgi:hypothetical protein